MTATLVMDQERFRLIEGRLHDPFPILGRHQEGKETVVRVFLPHTQEVSMVVGMRQLA